MKLTNELYDKLQETFIKQTGIKVGDTVKVTRVAETGEMGWDVYWNDEMKGNVTQKITEIRGNGNGFRLEDGYVYPFFVLEVVKNPLPKDIPLSGYDVKFLDNGVIKVGCETISFDKLEKIYKTAKGLV